MLCIVNALSRYLAKDTAYDFLLDFKYDYCMYLRCSQSYKIIIFSVIEQSLIVSGNSLIFLYDCLCLILKKHDKPGFHNSQVEKFN